MTPNPTRKSAPTPSLSPSARIQSLFLVVVALPLLILFASADILNALNTHWPTWLTAAILISAAFATLVWRMRSATPLAALAGGFICLNALERQSIGTGWLATAFPSITVLFILTWASTRFGRARKEALGIAEPRHGRQASQVIANLGIAGWLAGGVSAGWAAACIAALAEAAADTVSSEMGQAIGGTPRMILTGKPAPPGTDGAITLAGSACGIAAAALVALTALATGFLHPTEAAIAFAAGTSGLFFDSLLGATLERKGWLGNDLVNFTSTAFAASVAVVIARILT